MEIKVNGMALTFRVPDWHGGPDWFRYDSVMFMMLSRLFTRAHALWLRVAREGAFTPFSGSNAHARRGVRAHMCLRGVCGCTHVYIYANAARECGGDLGGSTRGVRVLLGNALYTPLKPAGVTAVPVAERSACAQR